MTQDPFIGRVLGGEYRLDALLGRGGMGAVYRAHQPRLDRDVAVKFRLAEPGDPPTERERFLNEAKTSSRLRHPHNVRVLDFGEDAGTLYIVMELVDGLPITRFKLPWPTQRALAVMRQVAGALAEAHGLGLVHRDLKPDNILLTRVDDRDFARVMDYGIARDLSRKGRLTASGVMIGTPRYIAPEQVTGGEIDGRTDLYALGVILYELVTGDVPFQGTHAMELAAAHVQRTPTPPTQLEPDLPRAVEALILQCLEKTRARRPNSANELVERLEALERGLTGEIPIPETAERPAVEAGQVTSGPTHFDRPRRNFWPWLLLLLPLGVVAWIVTMSTKGDGLPPFHAQIAAGPDTPPPAPGTGEGSEPPVQAASPDPPPGFVRIPAGRFSMGSPLGELGRYDDETTFEGVITRDLFVQVHEVTQGEWAAVMGINPSKFPACGRYCPVERATWFDALLYANARSYLDGLPLCYELTGCGGQLGAGASCIGVSFVGLDCPGYRLPTEAEWEYAARAGVSSALTDGSSEEVGRPSTREELAWFRGNSEVDYEGRMDCALENPAPIEGTTVGCGPHPVGEKAPNAWGLYDVLGNVWEWTWDWYGAYPSTPLTNPLGPRQGMHRVLRGGSWAELPRSVRLAMRGIALPEHRGPAAGVRLVRTAPPARQ